MADQQTLMEPEQGLGLDVGEYLSTIWSRKGLVVLTALLTVGIVLAASLLLPPRYRSATQLLYDPSNFEVAVFGSRITEEPDKPRAVETGVELVKLEGVAESVNAELDPPFADIKTLLESISVRARGESDLIEVAAVSSDRERAATIANAFATVFVEFRQNTQRAKLAEARELVEQQLASLPPGAGGSAAAQTLQQRLEVLRTLQALQVSDFTIVQDARPAEEPFSPRPVRNGLAALAVGLLAGAGLALVVARRDKRIRDEQGLERAFGLPVLSSVPQLSRDAKHAHAGVGFINPHSAYLEAYRILRANLQFFQVDRPLRIIMVTSPLPEQGKTLTAVNLALSLAMSGARVLLVDTDLRRPKVHHYLGLSNECGLSGMLAEQQSLRQCVQEVELARFVPSPDGRSRGPEAPAKAERAEKEATDGEGVLLCVTAGPPPPNPAEILGSARMREMLGYFTDVATYVVLDSPPLLPFADTLSLAGAAHGLVLTARMGTITVDDARQTRVLLERAGAHVLGVVAVGVERGRILNYGEEYARS